ncbi:MAG: hypothetical protein WD152_04320 [Nitriliruptoraceae bacterium]
MPHSTIYRAEVLFVHGIHQETPSSEITDEQWAAMWATLQSWMRWGVFRRIITIDPREYGLGRKDAAHHRMTFVYRQEHCRRCGTPVRQWDLAGRWAYACEPCQPRPPDEGHTRRLQLSA